MIIKIENSKWDDVILRNDKLIGFITTKLDKENHGLGLKNARKAIDKYNNVLRYKIKSIRF